jgi:hypothetical protein
LLSAFCCLDEKELRHRPSPLNLGTESTALIEALYSGRYFWVLYAFILDQFVLLHLKPKAMRPSQLATAQLCSQQLATVQLQVGDTLLTTKMSPPMASSGGAAFVMPRAFRAFDPRGAVTSSSSLRRRTGVGCSLSMQANQEGVGVRGGERE